MGYDLVAKAPGRGAVDYYRAGIENMAFLRAAMLAAGVHEGLVYKKFVSNDDLLVTSLQASTIAQKLTTWLQGRKLTLDLADTDDRVQVAADVLAFVLKAVGPKKEAAALERRRRARSLPFRVDRTARKAIRGFATFCAGSGGFYVD